MTEVNVIFEGARRSFQPGQTARIGRSLDNEVVISNPAVSRQHARLAWASDRWVFENIGRAATYLNGEPVVRVPISGPVDLTLAAPAGPALRIEPAPAPSALAGSPGGLQGFAAAGQPPGFPPSGGAGMPAGYQLTEAAGSPAGSGGEFAGWPPAGSGDPAAGYRLVGGDGHSARSSPAHAGGQSSGLGADAGTPPDYRPDAGDARPAGSAGTEAPYAGAPGQTGAGPGNGTPTPGSPSPGPAVFVPEPDGYGADQPGSPGAFPAQPGAGQPGGTQRMPAVPSTDTAPPGRGRHGRGSAATPPGAYLSGGYPGGYPPGAHGPGGYGPGGYGPPGRSPAAAFGRRRPRPGQPGGPGRDELLTALNILIPIKSWLTDPSWRHGLRLLVIPYALLPLLFLALFASSSNLTTPGWAYSLYIAPLWVIAFWLLIRPGPVRRPEALIGLGIVVWVVLWMKIVTVHVNGALVPNPGHAIHFAQAIGIGFNEEITKALPILVAAFLLLRLRSAKLDVRMWMFFGTIAGLTFGVVEQAAYTVIDILSIHQAHASSQAVGAVLAFSERVFVDGFQHAIWAGVAAFFIGMAINYPRRRWQLIIFGISIPAVLHGLNDWSLGYFSTPWVWIFIQAISVVLFLGYTGSAAAIVRQVKHTPMFRGESMLMDVVPSSQKPARGSGGLPPGG